MTLRDEPFWCLYIDIFPPFLFFLLYVYVQPRWVHDRH